MAATTGCMYDHIRFKEFFKEILLRNILCKLYFLLYIIKFIIWVDLMMNFEGSNSDYLII